MDVQEFVNVFLIDKSLESMMTFLCESSIEQSLDPVVDTISMMISVSINPIISEVGVAPFYNKPTHVYPYTEMTPCQREYIKQVVRTCASSIKRGMSGGPVGLSVSVQMGGGCIINPLDNTSRRVYLKADNVFRVLCGLVFSSGVHTDVEIRRNVCNIILQRVSGVVNIGNETAGRIGEFVDSLAGVS